MAAKRQKTGGAAAPAYVPGQPAGNESSPSALTIADVPGHGRFFLTAAALEMIGVFGGTLHCYLGSGGCRKQGLYFSRTLPRKTLRCELRPGTADHSAVEADGLEISVSHDLAPKLDGAVLDFGLYNKMQRFIWTSLPAVKGPPCTCLRSMGVPAGKRSPCLDDAGTGLTDL
jgi:Fe-S cluster assembly iron-binding protein IscA